MVSASIWEGIAGEQCHDFQSNKWQRDESLLTTCSPRLRCVVYICFTSATINTIYQLIMCFPFRWPCTWPTLFSSAFRGCWDPGHICKSPGYVRWVISSNCITLRTSMCLMIEDYSCMFGIEYMVMSYCSLQPFHFWSLSLHALKIHINCICKFISMKKSINDHMQICGVSI